MKWEEARLDELGTVSRGRSRHRPRDAAHLYGGPYPFVQTGDVKAAGLHLTKHSQTYTDAGLAQSKLWPAGTLCITIAANIADTAILSYDACFPDSVIGFIPDPERADARFVKYLFDAQLKSRYRTFTQGVAQDNLSQEKLLSIRFQVPGDVHMQRSIADLLSAYDDLIENNRRRIAILEALARNLYQEWFVRLRFPGHETTKIVDGVPEGWSRSSLGSITTKIGSGATPRGGEAAYQPTGIALIRSQNVYDDRFESAGLARISDQQAKELQNVRVETGDILLNITGASVARCCLVPEHVLPARVNQHVMIIRVDARTPASFVIAAINDPETKRRLLSLSQGGATREALTKDLVGSFEILIPDQKLLDRYHAISGPLLQQRQTLESISQTLSRARDLLLPRLMSGELEV